VDKAKTGRESRESYESEIGFVFIRENLRLIILQLQILVGPAANALERFVQVLHGVGNAEAQIAFAELAKRRT
jgi:hypothetical protein